MSGPHRSAAAGLPGVRNGADLVAPKLAAGDRRCTDGVDPGADAAGRGCLRMFQRRCFSGPRIRSPGDPRSPAGLSVAGSCGRPQIGGSVQCADATPSHCHHNGNRKPGGSADCAVDQPVAAVKGASR